MYFIGTRKKEKVSAAQAILWGVPDKGGLFVPEEIPILSKEELSSMIEMNYAERAAFILNKFLVEFGEEFLKEACEKAYSSFEGKDPVPLVRIDENKYILELYHGNTAAYEDFSVNLLPALIRKSRDLLKENKKLLFIMATNGDAGKAVSEIFKNDMSVKVAAIYPDETISKMQRTQVCIQNGENILVLGIKGDFECCKKTVARTMVTVREPLLNKGYLVTTASSANIARILPQIAYYFSAYIDLVSSEQIEMGSEIDFAVPVGDADNLIAGWYAKKMGLPIRKLLCSANRNRSLSGLISKGEIDTKRTQSHTMSPSMDVICPSNLERFLFEFGNRDAENTKAIMEEFEKNGKLTFSFSNLDDFYSTFASEDDTVNAMYDLFDEYGYPTDTHTGVALAVCEKYLEKLDEKNILPVVILAVSNPYKFPQDVLYALSGNDVKDCFKGIKKLHLLTAMKPPKCLVDLRYKPLRFKQVIAADTHKLAAEIVSFADGKITPETEDK